MIWTLTLVPISILGVWLAAHHWYGWAISLLSEFLWGAYAISLHSTSLLIMSFVWAGIHARNTVSTYRRQHVKPLPRNADGTFVSPSYRVSDGIVVREGPALRQLRPPTSKHTDTWMAEAYRDD